MIIDYHPRFIELRRVAKETLQHLNTAASERDKFRAVLLQIATHKIPDELTSFGFAYEEVIKLARKAVGPAALKDLL